MKNEKNQLLNRAVNAVKNNFTPDHVFWENEVKANLLVAKFMIVCAAGLALCWLLNAFGVLAISQQFVFLIFPVGIMMFLIPAALCLLLKGEKSWIKYLVMLSLILTLSYLDGILTFNVPLFIIVPVVFSCWYYSRSFTTRVALLTTLAFTVSAFLGAYFNADTPDMNFVTADRASYIRAVMLQSFLPRWLLFAVIASVCNVIASLGRSMVIKQDTISKAGARVEAELDMAGKIQSQALPSVEKLPASSYRDFEIAARMMPAREVGGDFYDFFYPDPQHLALIIADVADKGIAASLYMMMSKLMLDNKLTISQSPGRVLEEVNRQLYEKSFRGMFVTVWLGVLDLRTGDLITANAGHEYPVIRRHDGDFELIRDKHGFVLGGAKGMKYKDTLLHLDEGDVLFVYTDGVPEANSPEDALFGETRMLDSLNRCKGRSMKELIDTMKQDIDRFADGAPQFDDITMLAFRLLSPRSHSYTAAPEISALDGVQSYMEEFMERAELPELQAKRISICVDEIFSNIAKYSGASSVEVDCDAGNEKFSVIFRDDGIPFDPLSAEAPDITLPAKERMRGGLGIFITRKYMDNVEYAFVDGRNTLTITSNLF